jgi:hypothetical protein
MENGFLYIFEEAANIYKNTGPKFEDFRFSRDIYGFCINEGYIDNQAMSYAKMINAELYKKFLDQPKSLVGYKGHEHEYTQHDDLDSKHIMQLTFLFNNSNMEFNRIVEIGGGFGNMCRLCNNIIKYNNWDIIDLPHMLELQKFYLENEMENMSKIKFVDAHEKVSYNNSVDLVIGTHSVSEFSWEIFLDYFRNVISKSKYFFMGYNKNCPSPALINYKLTYLLNHGFTIVKNFDYTEIPHGANVSYTLYMNNTFPSNLPKVFAVGDSHSIFYFKSKTVKHHWLGWGGMPVTMYKFIEKGVPLYNIVERLPPGDICNINVKDNDIVLFCFGWNDIQKNIYKYGKDNYEEMIHNLVVDYINSIKKYSDGTHYKIRPIINCVYPLPLSINDTIFGTDEERIQYTILINSKLKEECAKSNLPFFDIYDILNNNGKLKPELLEKDGTHLNLENHELRMIIEDKLFKLIYEFYKEIY